MKILFISYFISSYEIFQKLLTEKFIEMKEQQFRFHDNKKILILFKTLQNK